MTLRLQSATWFPGPNVWSSTPIFCVDLGAEPPNGLIDDGARRALEQALRQVEFRSAMNPNSGQRAAPASANPMEWAGWLSVTFQRMCEAPVEQSFHQSTRFAFEALHRRTGKVAAHLALRLMNHTLYGSEPDFTLDRELALLARLNRAYDHGPVGRAIAAEARRRAIPLSTTDPRGRIVELGNGRFRQRILGTMTSRTIALGNLISDDKLLTNRFLASAGFPVPQAVPVRDAEQSCERAAHIGYPVVLKPMDQADSYLVFVDIRNETELRTRFETIAQGLKSHQKPLLLERFIPGNVYRALIVGDQVAGVFQRIPAHVIGNGTSSIRQLVAQENAQPRRQRAELHQIPIDAETMRVLERQQLTLESIPESGRTVALKPQIGHKRDGGLARDCTDELHPDNARLLIEATRTIGLDIAGIDFVTRNCSRPMLADGGAIIEINSRPDFERHLRPSEGASRDGASALIDLLFPPGQPVRVPIVAVTDAEDSADLCQLISEELTTLGHAVGRATHVGIVIDGLTYLGADGTNPTGPRTLLNHPAVDTAVVEVDCESIVTHGLGFDICDVVVLRSLSGLLRPSGEPVETVLIDVLSPNGTVILHSSDPAMHPLADRWPGPVFSLLPDPESGDAQLLAVAQHVAAALNRMPTAHS